MASDTPPAAPLAVPHPAGPRPGEQTVLVLQGGGALGAYQAGAYEALAETGYSPQWLAGISLGAVNAALIAGNPPEKRLPALRSFWEAASSRLMTQPKIGRASLRESVGPYGSNSGGAG